MVEYRRDESGKIFAYEMTEEEMKTVAIDIAVHGSRLSNMESDIRILRDVLARVEQNQHEQRDFFKTFVQDAWPIVKKANEKIDGTPGCPGIEARLVCAEKITNPVYWFGETLVKFWPIILGIGAAAAAYLGLKKGNPT
jgi:hypothetical protein